tara:strand:- start:3127 stop:3306 length:180 start_codon:yes stop_codon:yes gene_type:complete
MKKTLNNIMGILVARKKASDVPSHVAEMIKEDRKSGNGYSQIRFDYATPYSVIREICGE